MALTEIFTELAPSPGGPYSQAMKAGNLLWTAGQVGIDPATGIVPSDFRSQTRQALGNLKAVIEASGATLADVAKTTCFLANIDDFAEFNAIYAEFFGEHRPARSTLAVALVGGFVFEIEAIVVDGRG